MECQQIWPKQASVKKNSLADTRKGIRLQWWYNHKTMHLRRFQIWVHKIEGYSYLMGMMLSSPLIHINIHQFPHSLVTDMQSSGPHGNVVLKTKLPSRHIDWLVHTLMLKGPWPIPILNFFFMDQFFRRNLDLREKTGSKWRPRPSFSRSGPSNKWANGCPLPSVIKIEIWYTSWKSLILVRLKTLICWYLQEKH